MEEADGETRRLWEKREGQAEVPDVDVLSPYEESQASPRSSPSSSPRITQWRWTPRSSPCGHGGPLCAIKLSALMANHNVIVTHGTRPQGRIQVYAGCLYVAQSGRLDAG